MIALCLALCVMFGVFIRPSLNHDNQLPTSAPGKAKQ